MTPSVTEVDKAVKGVLNNAQKKLIIAIVLCAAFMSVELVAGIFAHSLAILTDAAHMLSDVCSFGISLFAIHISGMPGTMKMSFGYARAEILGALISILLIWGLTIWLVAEAVNRIIHPQDVKAPIMVYTAIFGIVTNIALATVLDHHHHHHGHGHGHHSHEAHDHGHAHAHHHGSCHGDHEEHRASQQQASHSHATVVEQGARDEPETLLITALKPNSDSRPENTVKVASVASSLSPSANSGSVVLDELPTPSAGAAAESYRAAASMLKDLGRRSIGTPCDSSRRQSKVKDGGDDIYVSIEDEPACQVVTEASGHCDGHSHSKNINISAAYLHALGDLLQNLGVLIGGLIIWWKPTWTVADPICTLLFSVLVFSTTFGILRDAANVLMEGTPAGIDPAQIVDDLRTIPNVSEVHDVHVWSLSVGKPSLACHIVIDDPTKAKRVLASATSLIQVKYLILHTTIQVGHIYNIHKCISNMYCPLLSFSTLRSLADRLAPFGQVNIGLL